MKHIFKQGDVYLVKVTTDREQLLPHKFKTVEEAEAFAGVIYVPTIKVVEKVAEVVAEPVKVEEKPIVKAKTVKKTVKKTK